MHENVLARASEEAGASWEWIVKFYRLCVLPIEAYLPTAYLYESYIAEQKFMQSEIVPRETFRYFIKELRQEMATAVWDGEASGE